MNYKKIIKLIIKYYLFVLGNELILVKGDVIPNSHHGISKWFWTIDDAMIYCSKYKLYISRIFGEIYDTNVDTTAHIDNCISITKAR